MIKLQCTECERRCVKGFYEKAERRSLTCPYQKQSAFKPQILKSRPGLYNARLVRI